MIKNKNILSILIGIVFPTVLLLLLSKMHLLLQNVFQGDGPGYWAIGEYILKNHDFNFPDSYHSYLYGLYLATIRYLTDGSPNSVLIVQSIVFILSIYWFVRTYIDKINLFSLILISVSPLSIYYAWTILTEALYIPLYFISLVFAAKYYQYNKKIYLYTALFIFALIATTKNHLLIFAILSMFILLLYSYKDKFSIVNLIKSFLIICLLIFLAKLPDLLANKKPDTRTNSVVCSSLIAGMHEFEDFPFSITSKNYFLEHKKEFDNRNLSFKDVIEEFLEHPLSAMRSYAFRIFRIWVPMQHYEMKSIGVTLSILYAGTIFCLFVFGIYLVLKYEKNRFFISLFLYPMLLLWIQQIFFHTESRYVSIMRLNEMYFAGYALYYIFYLRKKNV